MSDQKGTRDQLIDDFINMQKEDSVLSQFEHYAEEEINLSTDPNELNPGTPLPCRSLTFYDYLPAPGSCDGGMTETRIAEGRVISYYDPLKFNSELPSLDLLGEKAENVFEKAQRADNWPNGIDEHQYTVKEYEFRRTYKYPYIVPVGNVAKKLADTIITLFKIKVEVSLL